MLRSTSKLRLLSSAKPLSLSLMQPTHKALPTKFVAPYQRPERTETLPPPSDGPIEAAVLGAMLIEKPAVSTALALLRSNVEIFYYPVHQCVFSAILALASAGKDVDQLTVAQQLLATGELSKVGGFAGVASLTMQVNSAGNLPTHCAVLLELYTKRSIWRLAQQLLAKAFNPMVQAEELLAEAYLALNHVSTSMQTRRPQLVGELYDRVVDKIVAASQVEASPGVGSPATSSLRLRGRAWAKPA
jgi:replicative DNA helicase